MNTFWKRYRKLHWMHQIRPLIGIVTLLLVFGIALGSGLNWIWAAFAARGVLSWIDSLYKAIVDVYVDKKP